MKTFAGLLFAVLVLASSSDAFAACSNRPTAHNDVYNMAKNTTLSILFSTLAANDTDPDKSTGDTLSAYVIGPPSTGTYCGIAPDGVCYQPPTNFTGLVAIPYQVEDDCGNTDGGDVLIFVQ